jgi:phage gp46-like protein
VEQVHQHGLAAPDAAPEIDALRPARSFAEQALQESAAATAALQLPLKAGEADGSGLLLRIGAQLARGNERAVLVENGGQGGSP